MEKNNCIIIHKHAKETQIHSSVISLDNVPMIRGTDDPFSTMPKIGLSHRSSIVTHRWSAVSLGFVHETLIALISLISWMFCTS